MTLISHCRGMLCLLIILSALLVVNCDEDDEYVQTRFKRTYNRAHLPPRKVRNATVGTNKRVEFSELVRGGLRKRWNRARGGGRQIGNGNTSYSPLAGVCKTYPINIPQPIRCYHCESNTRKDKEPVCDHKLWKYLKHSEKARLRETCDSEAKFCAKILYQKLGRRITQRGCFSGDSIIASNGETIKPLSGCNRQQKGGYRVTTCLCNTDFCNAASTFNLNFYHLLLMYLSVVITKSYF